MGGLWKVGRNGKNGVSRSSLATVARIMLKTSEPEPPCWTSSSRISIS